MYQVLYQWLMQLLLLLFHFIFADKLHGITLKYSVEWFVVAEFPISEILLLFDIHNYYYGFINAWIERIININNRFVNSILLFIFSLSNLLNSDIITLIHHNEIIGKQIFVYDFINNKFDTYNYVPNVIELLFPFYYYK